MDQNNGCCDVAITLMTDHLSIHEWSLRLYNEVDNPPAMDEPSNITAYRCKFDFHERVFRVQVISDYKPWLDPAGTEVIRMKSNIPSDHMDIARDELKYVRLDNMYTPANLYGNKSQCWVLGYCSQCWVLDALDRLNEIRLFANDDEFALAHERLNILHETAALVGGDMKQSDDQ